MFRTKMTECCEERSLSRSNVFRCFFVLIALIAGQCGYALAQGRKPPPPPDFNRDNLPYKSNPDLPVFNVLLKDSVTTFNSFNIPKGKPIALMLFSPDCSHCSDAVNELTRGMDSLRNIRFYLMSLSIDMTAIRKFYDDHHLEKYSNIEVVGCDYDFFFLTFFGAMNIPSIALYDSDKKLVHFFDPPFTVGQIFDKAYSRH